MAKKQKKSKQQPAPPIVERPPKQQRLFDNVLRTTRQFIDGKGYKPLYQNELQQRLGFPEQHGDLFQEVLDQLVNDRAVSIKNGRYVSNRSPLDTVTGVLSLHPRGFGFVKGNLPDMGDIFIPKQLTMNAVDGDTVEVLVNFESMSDKGPEGKIISILSRARTHLAGTIHEVARDGSYYAYAPMLGSGQRILVETDGEELIVGDRIVMKVIEWGGKDSLTITKLANHIGHISDPSCDIKAAIEEFELRRDFSIHAIQEAQSFGKLVPASEIKKREDLRHLTTFTIDPDTAKDFDDAISLTKDERGHYHLGVHIADVSHYVKPGTALDEEAAFRCNSTYFPGFCLPMLPHELSSHLCSLKPNVNRLTISILMELDPTGSVVTYRASRSVIKSQKRFTYKEAKAVLDEKKKSPHHDALKLMVEVCGLLKKKRYERGSIEFGLPELVVLVDEKGVPTGTDYVVYDITHQLVEEFMLKANETVAQHLAHEGKHLTYRIHDEPSEENLKDFSMLASAFGFDLSPIPTPKEIQALFDEAMNTPYGEYLATSYIRRMKLAVYSSDNIGHYGLSLTHYCHFTSPIRRYVDLVVHRILFHQEEEKETLEKISEQCSAQERISAKAENSVVLLKKLRLLETNLKKDRYKEYEAVVTKVKNFGIHFEVLELMLESYLHVSELENDYFNFDDATMALKGVRTGFCYKAGDKMTVILKEVDLITLESKWDLVGQEPPAKPRVFNKRTLSAQEQFHKMSSGKKRGQMHPARKKGSTYGKNRKRR